MNTDNTLGENTDTTAADLRAAGAVAAPSTPTPGPTHEDRERLVLVCDECGEEFDGDEEAALAAGWIKTAGGKLVCPDCAGDYRRCRDCGKWFRIDDDMYHYGDDEWVCDECYCDHYSTCDICGDLIDRNNSNYHVLHDEYEVCEHCYENNCFRCVCCEEIFRTTESHYCTHNGDDLCEGCYDEDYFTCGDCGEVFLNEFATEIDGMYYCECCAADHYESLNGVMPYHAFKGRYSSCYADSLDVTPSTILMGVELEADGPCARFCPDDFRKWLDNDMLVHFEHDGSLSCDGVELITQPCSLRFHRERMDWQGLCDGLLRLGFLSHKTRSCGLHVHIGRRVVGAGREGRGGTRCMLNRTTGASHRRRTTTTGASLTPSGSGRWRRTRRQRLNPPKRRTGRGSSSEGGPT